jgi:hypothetical protein
MRKKGEGELIGLSELKLLILSLLSESCGMDITTIKFYCFPILIFHHFPHKNFFFTLSFCLKRAKRNFLILKVKLSHKKEFNIQKLIIHVLNSFDDNFYTGKNSNLKR